jgi:hypothetical protein
MRVTRCECGFLRRILEVDLDGAAHTIEYNGRTPGYERVSVDGALAAWHWSFFWFVPRFDFSIGSFAARVEVRVWPWLAVRTFRLTIDGTTVYSDRV